MFNCSKLRHLYLILPLVATLVSSGYAEIAGMWRFEHPELGGVFFRVKSDQTATYFLEDGVDTTIYKGKWSEIPTGLELTFENGVVISAGEMEPGVADARVAMSPGHDVAPGEVVCVASSVESRAIGSMTIDPEQDEDEEDERTGFFGGWEGELISGEKFYILVNEDRTAGISHSFSGSTDDFEGFTDIVGFWKKEGEKLHVYWNDGSFTSIETNGRRIEQTTFKNGELLEDAKGYTSRIIPFRNKDLPEAWYKEFKADYVSRMPIIVIRKISVVKKFFRGKWLLGQNDDGDQATDVIEIKRFGKAWTSRFGGVKGDWYPGADTATIYWRNGVKETLSVVGNRFLVKSFNPNQPVSGRPARIQVANPEDSDKMGYYLNRKRELLDPRRFFRGFSDAVNPSTSDASSEGDGETVE